MADAGHNFGAVVLDLHAPAAAVALLAAPKFVIYGFEGDRHSGGKACESSHQALAMGLPGGFKSQHSPRTLMLAILWRAMAEGWQASRRIPRMLRFAHLVGCAPFRRRTAGRILPSMSLRSAA